MATQTPIITSDRKFATEICGAGAAYFELSSPQDAASKIFDIINDTKTQKRLTDAGLKQLEVFPNVAQQMTLYREMLLELLNSNDFPTPK